MDELVLTECVECCGEGFDLDTLYETGAEEDCSWCGGDGTVPAN